VDGSLIVIFFSVSAGAHTPSPVPLCVIICLEAKFPLIALCAPNEVAKAGAAVQGEGIDEKGRKRFVKACLSEHQSLHGNEEYHLIPAYIASDFGQDECAWERQRTLIE